MDISSIEQFIDQIEGVECCRILCSDDEIQEIHVLSDSSRAPKQIARDIETAMITKFDMRIDRKIISIVQFKGTENGISSRIKFSGVSVSTDNNTVEVEVKLTYEDRVYSAKLVGVNTVSNKNRLIAEAALKVVQDIIGQAIIIYPNEVSVKEISEFTVATVLVTFKVNNFEEVLVGSAVIRSDINESIAKAALDAVNRRVKGIRL